MQHFNGALSKITCTFSHMHTPVYSCTVLSPLELVIMYLSTLYFAELSVVVCSGKNNLQNSLLIAENQQPLDPDRGWSLLSIG